MSGKPKEKKERVHKGGRNKVNIDWNVVDNFLIAGLDGVQVAANIGISPETLTHRCEKEKGMNWSLYRQIKYEKGNGLIHVAQFDKAIKQKSSDMLKHLGYHRLNQIPRLNINVESSTGVQIYLPSNGMEMTVPQEPNKEEKKDG